MKKLTLFFASLLLISCSGSKSTSPQISSESNPLTLNLETDAAPGSLRDLLLKDYQREVDELMEKEVYTLRWMKSADAKKINLYFFDENPNYYNIERNLRRPTSLKYKVEISRILPALRNRLLELMANASDEDQKIIQANLGTIKTLTATLQKKNMESFIEREAKVRSLMATPFNCSIKGTDLICNVKKNESLKLVQQRLILLGNWSMDGSISQVLEGYKYLLSEDTKKQIKTLGKELEDELNAYLCASKKIFEAAGAKEGSGRRCYITQWANEDKYILQMEAFRKLAEDEEVISLLRTHQFNEVSICFSNQNCETISLQKKDGKLIFKLSLSHEMSPTTFKPFLNESLKKRPHLESLYAIVEKNLETARQNLDGANVDFNIYSYERTSLEDQVAFSEFLVDFTATKPKVCGKTLTKLSFNDLTGMPSFQSNKMPGRKISIATAFKPFIDGPHFDLKARWQKSFERFLKEFEANDCETVWQNDSGDFLPEINSYTLEKNLDLITTRLDTESSFKVSEDNLGQKIVTIRTKIIQRNQRLPSYVLASRGSLVYPKPFEGCSVGIIGQFIHQDTDDELVQILHLKGSCDGQVDELRERKFTIRYSDAMSGNGSSVSRLNVMVK